jgi:hypothetical protein
MNGKAAILQRRPGRWAQGRPLPGDVASQNVQLLYRNLNVR